MKLIQLSRLVAGGLAICLVVALVGCKKTPPNHSMLVPGGNPQRGVALIEHHGCGSCHTIPGVRGADALVGPSLEHIASRSYVAGVLTNSPDHMQRWVKNAPAVDPMTAMPNLKLNDDDARDVVSYLYTLQ